MDGGTPSEVRVLYVTDGDEAEYETAEQLEAACDEFAVTVVSEADAVELVEAESIHCVIADDRDRLRELRKRTSTVPLVLLGDETVVERIEPADIVVPSPTDGESAVISDRIARIARLRRQRNRVEDLHRTAPSIDDVESVEAAYERIVAAADEVLRFDLCTVEVERDGELVAVATSEELPIDGYEDVPVDADSISGATYRTGESFLIDDVTEHPVADPVDPGYRSLISVPLGSVGVFQAVTTEREAFTETDLELTELLISHAVATLDRIRSEQALREERDRLVALFENVPDPIVHYETDESGSVIEDANSAFESVFGVSSEEIRGEAIGDLIVPPEYADEAERLAERATEGESLDAEVERLAADERRHFLLRNAPIDDGSEAGSFAIYTDITERKHYEWAVEQLHAATRELLQADDAEAIAAVAIRTSRDVLEFPYSAVFLWNESTERLEPADIPESVKAQIGEPPTFERGEGIAGTAFDASEPIVVDDAQADERASGDSDGRIRSYCVLPLGEHGVLTIASPEIDRFDESDVDLASILAANVTVVLDRAASERALRERERELERQNERLDEFASVVSHDLRNPINVAGGRLELAIDELDNEHVAIARDAVDRMDALVENVLRLARQGRNVGAPDWVRLDRLCERSWSTVTADVTDATIRTEAIDGLTIKADPDRLRQALENLFSNAIEHGDADVTVELGPLSDGFYVSDDGPGIPPEEREELFAFGETRSEDGTGIGLAIVRSIVRAHGWTVEVTESECGGTRFEIRGVEIGER